jgi:hypothetical protein
MITGVEAQRRQRRPLQRGAARDGGGERPPQDRHRALAERDSRRVGQGRRAQREAVGRAGAQGVAGDGELRERRRGEVHGAGERRAGGLGPGEEERGAGGRAGGEHGPADEDRVLPLADLHGGGRELDLRGRAGGAEDGEGRPGAARAEEVGGADADGVGLAGGRELGRAGREEEPGPGDEAEGCVERGGGGGEVTILCV